ncbi:MAG: hypothetical protein DRQ51_05590 [Gammaproteobacteria bacterium]|nr:MAG: hypothetical protein DRQ51_05590 [Gammaproteobacteria bacterium]
MERWNNNNQKYKYSYIVVIKNETDIVEVDAVKRRLRGMVEEEFRICKTKELCELIKNSEICQE